MGKLINISEVVDEVIASEIEAKGEWQWVTNPNYKQARALWDEIEEKAGLSKQPQEDKNFFEDVLDELIDAKFEEQCDLRIEELYNTAERFTHIKNGHYFFKKGNRYKMNKYSEAEATLCNSTLNNCADCTNCKNCTNCLDCVNCVSCKNCSGCVICANCDSCTDCYDCVSCIGCTNCDVCDKCIDCTKCDKCIDCTNCSKCENCQKCSKCKFCKRCNNSVWLEFCENCSCCHDTTFAYSEFRLNHSDKQFKYLKTDFNDCKICEELKK